MVNGAFRSKARARRRPTGRPGAESRPVAAAEPARLRSTPKGAQGLEVAEGLRPYRSLRQRLQGGVCCEAVGCAFSVGAKLARDGVGEAATPVSACRRRKACGTMAAHVFWKLPG
ncbi:hypothetical protein EMIT0373P_11709 [Pseudomonas chlororaphis]